MATVDDVMRRLPPDLQDEVKDFAEFLLEKRSQQRGGIMPMRWEGALREHRDQYTALDLQKKSLEWRGD